MERSSKTFLRIFARKPAAMIAAGYLALLVVTIVLAPLIAPYGPDDQDLTAVFALPNSRHWLGTGELGTDVLSRLMYGGHVSLSAMLAALASFVIVGVPAGMVAGYQGGWFDQLILKLADIAFAVPSFIILLVVLAIFPGEELLAMAIWGALASPGVARVVRSAALGVRKELYVRAAAASGLRGSRIVARHIAPAVAGIAVVQASIFASGAVITESGLGFLGLGTKNASWGNLISEASHYVGSDPWLLVPSGFVLISFIVAVNLTGDGIRDSLAESRTVQLPKRRRRPDPEVAAVQRPGNPAQPNDPGPEGLLSVSALSVSVPIDGVATAVVTDVSFDICRGEVLGVLGESGCGKSVTAASILGLVPRGGAIAGGSIRFGGLDLARATSATLRRVRGARIGWVAQDPLASLDPSFTAGSQVAEVIRAHRGCSRAEARRRTLELFARVQLGEPERVARSFPHQLSGGMAQRVGIAAAIAVDPDLIVADEPTASLDVTVQAEILDLLRTLREDGTAVLLITHDWGVLADICDRVVVMYAGQIVESATTQDLARQPAHPYTAALQRADPGRSPAGVPLPALEGTVPPPSAWPVGCRFQDRCPLVEPECRTQPIPLTTVGTGSRSSRCVRGEELVNGGVDG